MNASTALPGYGSKLYCEICQGSGNYFLIAQLRKFTPSGSKQTEADQTNLRTGDRFTRMTPVLVDAGELELDGVYSGDYTQLVLGRLHGALIVANWRVTLSDGTRYSFQASVSQFKPWDVAYNKFIPFSAKLRVNGPIESPLSGFQPSGFGRGFQTVPI